MVAQTEGEEAQAQREEDGWDEGEHVRETERGGATTGWLQTRRGEV